MVGALRRAARANGVRVVDPVFYPADVTAASDLIDIVRAFADYDRRHGALLEQRRQLAARDDEVSRAALVRLKPLDTLGDAGFDAVLVPEEAVISTGTGQFVFVVEGGSAVRTEVKLGQRLPGEVEVLSGLEPGVLVVIGGLQKIRDGVPVQPLAPKVSG